MSKYYFAGYNRFVSRNKREFGQIFILEEIDHVNGFGYRPVGVQSSALQPDGSYRNFTQYTGCFMFDLSTPEKLAVFNGVLGTRFSLPDAVMIQCQPVFDNMGRLQRLYPKIQQSLCHQAS